MAQVVCKFYGKGPFCSDPRIERTGAEQTDCFTQAVIAAKANAWNCIARKYSDQGCLSGIGVDEPIPGCVHDLECYQYMTDERDALGACFCTSLKGLVCSSCPDTTEDTTTTTPDNTPGAKNIQPISLTAASWDGPIPVPFGTVIVPGNIVWIGNAVKTIVTVTDTSGANITTTNTETGQVDMIIGLCVGEIAGIRRIWINDTLVVNNSYLVEASTTSTFNKTYYDLGLNVSFLSGSEAQQVLSNTAELGRTPAYRGLALLVMRNFPIVVSLNNIPSIRVEVVTAIKAETRFVTLNPGYNVQNDLLSVDWTSDRALVHDISGNLHVIDISNMEEINEITAATTRATFTSEGDIVYQTSAGATRYVFGYDHSDFIDFTGPDISSDGDFAQVYLHSSTGLVHNIVVFAKGQDVSMYEIDWNARTATLVQTQTSIAESANILRLLVDDFRTQFDVSPSINKMFLAFCNTTDNLAVAVETLESFSGLQYYDPTRLSTEYGIFGYQNTLVDPITVVDAFPDTDGSAFIGFIESAGRKYICRYYVKPLQIFWLLEVDEHPSNFAATRKVRPGVSHSYVYITTTGNIMQLNLSFGNLEQIGTLADYSAPDIAGPQYYDPAHSFIVYRDTNGHLTKLFINRFNGAETSVADIMRRTLEIAGIDDAFIDVSAVDTVQVEGYIIDRQNSGLAVVQEVAEFFHVSAIDSSGLMKFRPMSSFQTITVPDDDTGQLTRTRVLDPAKYITSVEVTYYDINRDGSNDTQLVTRDFMDTFPDFVSNAESFRFGASVFTTANTAILSAEREMLRLLQRRDTLTLNTMPKHLAMEAGDFVDGYRISKLTIDDTLEMKAQGMTDDGSIYQYTPALDGTTINFPDTINVDYDAPMRNYLVTFPLPPTEDLPANECLYVGLAEPDSSPAFVASTIFTRGPELAEFNAGTPTRQALVGRLVSAPAFITNAFQTDYTSSFVIKFNKPAATYLQTATAAQIAADYRRNLLFIGKELVQYHTYSIDVDTVTVTFTGLVRGRFGTDDFIGSHVAGELCAVYTTDSIAIGQLGSDATEFGMAIARTYDTRAPSVRRTDEQPFTPQKNHRWQVSNVKAKKVSTGSLLDKGVFFRVHPRYSFQNTFDIFDATEIRERSTYTGEDRFCLCVLASVFDESTFLTNFAQLNFPVGDLLSGNDNAYILRFFSLNDASSMVIQYNINELAFDGVNMFDEIHIATFMARGNTIVSKTHGISFEANFPYTNYEVGFDRYAI